jgi:hypothetical protein
MKSDFQNERSFDNRISRVFGNKTPLSIHFNGRADLALTIVPVAIFKRLEIGNLSARSGLSNLVLDVGGDLKIQSLVLGLVWVYCVGFDLIIFTAKPDRFPSLVCTTICPQLRKKDEKR